MSIPRRRSKTPTQHGIALEVPAHNKVDKLDGKQAGHKPQGDIEDGKPQQCCKATLQVPLHRGKVHDYKMPFEKQTQHHQHRAEHEVWHKP
jgi:hypothetical protein